MRWLFIWFAAFLLTIVAVVASYYWLDRPIALAMHQGVVLSGHGWWRALARIPNPLVPVSVLMLVVFGVKIVRHRHLTRLQSAIFVAALATILTEAIKEQLKFAFGRAWPESWAGSNPSFIRDGIYGFHPFHGSGYNSFPSGHTATACAILAVLWVWYPKMRPILLVAGLLVAGGLVAANYHFLSDVIAGAFLGATIGLLVTGIWHAQNFRSRD
jgi:membrane-associated phospholipid phosphatase